ncbi:MAG: precorrin-2 C(20)-methyltransferase [Rhodobacteraceae bacterium]|nr:precorrin-2 C(20)-methyltransferase [Paracoccaceae bacterium]
MSGTLYGVGLGPGDPELMTLKAHRLISNAKVICYPAADSGPSLARSIAADIIPKGALEISVVLPMRESRQPAKDVYDQAADALSLQLESGQDVVTLCEGDPFFYGSFMYLFERLSQRFAVEIVPGVTSLTACAAALNRPLTSRMDTLAVLPGTLPDADLRHRIENAQSIALMKVGRHLERVKTLLEDMQLIDNAGIVERASQANQTVHRLADYPHATAPYFSMVLIYKGDEAWTLPRSLSS